MAGSTRSSTRPRRTASRIRDGRFAYTTDGLDHIASITLQQYDANSTSGWDNVRQKTYTYYGADESFGLAGDLKTITTEQWDANTQSWSGQWDASAQMWTGDDTYYFRYYTDAGQEHELERALLPNSYASFVNAYGDPTNEANWGQSWFTDDSQTGPISNYTCFYYTYDTDRRVSKEIVFGKSNESDYVNTISGNENDYNNWAKKSVETLPNNSNGSVKSTNTVYTNYLGQTLLTDLYDAASQTHTLTYNRYDGEGRLILTAEPSAFVLYNGKYYDDSLPDLIDWDVVGGSPYLSDTTGLFQKTVYYASTSSGIGDDTAGGVEGYVYETAVAQGETAARLAVGSQNGPILLSSYTYYAHTANGQTIYPVASYTTYSDDAGQDGSTTSYAYTWYTTSSHEFQVQQETVTEPAVSGTSATTQEWFDDHGNVVWSMNELGRVTYNAYDPQTDYLVETVADIDTGEATSLGLTVPTDCSLPTSGGVNAITDYQHDALGRVTQTLGPAHMADIGGTMTNVRTARWDVYLDAVHENRTAQGYVVVSTGAAVIVGPISIKKSDRDGRVTDQIQAAYTDSETTSADILANLGTATIAQSDYTAWTTYQYANTRLVGMRVYDDDSIVRYRHVWRALRSNDLRLRELRRQIRRGGRTRQLHLMARSRVMCSTLAATCWKPGLVRTTTVRPMRTRATTLPGRTTTWSRCRAITIRPTGSWKP